MPGEVEAPSLRETIESAVDSVESAPSPSPSPEPSAAPEGASSSSAPSPTEGEAAAAAARARDDKGRFATGKPATPPPPGNGASAAPGPGGAKATGVAPAAPVAQPVPSGEAAVKPPQSWAPTARERWSSLPAEVQNEVARRERDHAKTLQESATARKFQESFREVIRPYEGMIRAEGVTDPLAAVRSVMATAAALRTAPPHHRAELVADIIRTYNVDVQAVGSYLVGQAPQGQPNGAPQYRDPRVDELAAKLADRERRETEMLTRRQQEMATRADSEVEDFAAKHEFFGDVAETMADLMEVAARRKVALDKETAYTQAVALHPEISKIVSQRAAAKAATTGSPATSQARAAASSVRSAPAGGAPTPASGKSLRADIEAALDQVSGR